MKSDSASDLSLYGRLLQQALPYRLHIVGLFLLSLLSTPLALLGPLPLKIAVDCVVGSDPLPGVIEAVLPESLTSSDTRVLILAAALVLLIAVITQLQSLTTSLLRTYTGEKLVLDFRARLFRHVQRLSLAYHDSKGTADSTYRIQYDTSAVQYVAIDGVIPFITSAVTVVAMLYISFQLDWQLALVALVVSPFLFMSARIYRKHLRRQSRAVKKLESSALSVVQEVLTALRVVKAFSQEDREQERFMRHSQASLRARLKLTVAESSLGLIVGLITSGGTAVVLYVGAQHVLAGRLSLGELLLVMGYLGQLYGPLKTISKKIASLQSHLASAERAFSLLDEASDVPEKPHARAIERAVGAFALKNVSFAYEPDHPVLRNISFEVSAGTRVGIAGRTGAGKTTLVNLLTRFYDPTSGQILLDGVDLRDYKLADLRNQFAIVLQEPVLFSTTIAENIAYARPEAEDEAIIAAAQAANAHEFIVDLPEGYDTLVGERGMRLSGGERQRIGLARAFLKDAPILILDEPTSSVDVKTEAGIMEAIERLMKGRTTFMIAHRLSTLDSCDVLLAVENARVIDSAITQQDSRGRSTSMAEPPQGIFK